MSSLLLPAVAPDVVAIPSRWNGPRRYGNGGYSAGVFATGMGPHVRVVLRRPVPLERRLRIERPDPARARVLAGRRLVAEVAALPAIGVEDPPATPTLDAAEAAVRAYPWADRRHALSDCGVCSVNRRDGLGITPGPLAGETGLLASVFHTHSGLADELDRDVVRPEFVWAALDCPSFPAEDLAAGRIRLLGTLEVERAREVFVGESLVVVGWTRAHGGRSVATGSALLDADGRTVASARAVWVAPRRAS